MSDHELSKCPNCGSRGTYLDDEIRMDGYTVTNPYCGFCGRNWPKHTDRLGRRLDAAKEARDAAR